MLMQQVMYLLVQDFHRQQLFEVVVGTIISGLYNDMKINSVEIAQISQYAENVFFKKAVRTYGSNGLFSGRNG